MSRSYPRIRDVTTTLHPEIEITWKEGDLPRRFCGDNRCTGSCNLPALMITFPHPYDSGHFLKASGSQVACGNVMQAKKVEWRGERVEVPGEYREIMERRIWL